MATIKVHVLQPESHITHAPLFRHLFDSIPTTNLLRGGEVLAEFGVVLNLSYHLIENFHVKVRAYVAGDKQLRCVRRESNHSEGIGG